MRQALRFAPLVFVRPGELREAQWHEFNLHDKQPEWHIPAQRMKMGEHHIVPLARQAVGDTAAKQIAEQALDGDARVFGRIGVDRADDGGTAAAREPDGFTSEAL